MVRGYEERLLDCGKVLEDRKSVDFRHCTCGDDGGATGLSGMHLHLAARGETTLDAYTVFQRSGKCTRHKSAYEANLEVVG